MFRKTKGGYTPCKQENTLCRKLQCVIDGISKTMFRWKSGKQTMKGCSKTLQREKQMNDTFVGLVKNSKKGLFVCLFVYMVSGHYQTGHFPDGHFPDQTYGG